MKLNKDRVVLRTSMKQFIVIDIFFCVNIGGLKCKTIKDS